MNIIFYPKIHQEAIAIEMYLIKNKFAMIPNNNPKRIWSGHKNGGTYVFIEQSMYFKWYCGYIGVLAGGSDIRVNSIKEVIDNIKLFRSP